MDDRNTQACGTCGSDLEVLISSTVITASPLGFAPGVRTADGSVFRAGKRRPATTKRGP